ncbi:MAG: hypothetical protein II697_00140, partial [Clostridia bacterium]|nr:hypothetical protein [Clostridia bacterium]
MQFLLKLLRKFPGAKTVRNEFLLSQGKLCFAKIVLGAAKLPLRIESWRGCGPSKLLWGFCIRAKAPVLFMGRLLR